MGIHSHGAARLVTRAPKSYTPVTLTMCRCGLQTRNWPLANQQVLSFASVMDVCLSSRTAILATSSTHKYNMVLAHCALVYTQFNAHDIIGYKRLLRPLWLVSQKIRRRRNQKSMFVTTMLCLTSCGATYPTGMLCLTSCGVYWLIDMLTGFFNNCWRFSNSFRCMLQKWREVVKFSSDCRWKWSIAFITRLKILWWTSCWWKLVGYFVAYKKTETVAAITGHVARIWKHDIYLLSLHSTKVRA
jgi:hypothetical protein